MSKHNPEKKPSCADADRCADEQIDMLLEQLRERDLDVARLQAEVAGLRTALGAPRYPNFIPATQPYRPWYPTPYYGSYIVSSGSTSTPIALRSVS